MGQGVTAPELKSELDKNGYKETTVTGSAILRVKFEKTGHIYMIKTNGEIAMSLPSDKDPDKKIVEILGSGIALTESEKVVTLGVKTEEMTREEMIQIFIEGSSDDYGISFTTFEEIVEYEFNEGEIGKKYNSIEEYAERMWV